MILVYENFDLYIIEEIDYKKMIKSILLIIWYQICGIILFPLYGFKNIPNKIHEIEKKRKIEFEKIKEKSNVGYIILKGILITIFIVYTIYYVFLT